MSVDFTRHLIEHATYLPVKARPLYLGSLTTAQRNLLPAINGLTIYNATTNQFEFYQAGAWRTFTAPTPPTPPPPTGIPVNIAVVNALGADTINYVRRDHVHDGRHNVLSAMHNDVLAAAVVRGDIIRGNATPAWSRYALGGAGRLLRSDGIDLLYSGFTIPDTFPVGSILYASALDVLSALGIGADDQVLTTESGFPAWAGGLKLISDQLLDAPTASVIFNNIPQTYKHLILIGKSRSSDAGVALACRGRLNNDVGNNYYVQAISGNQASAFGVQILAANLFSFGGCAGSGAVANGFSTFSSTIVDYTSTTALKTAISTTIFVDTVAANLFTGVYSVFWNSTVAITRIDVFPSLGNFLAGSRFTLYGVS